MGPDGFHHSSETLKELNIPQDKLLNSEYKLTEQQDCFITYRQYTVNTTNDQWGYFGTLLDENSKRAHKMLNTLQYLLHTRSEGTGYEGFSLHLL